ncbi:alanine racemase [Homoserinimonas aerilata]|uniref:Alanine racemase n=1 Tax=Homoserinimonas aerilata TaxID=1162970 RepID=A0A542YIK9_9MICO|nr:alanine racemase [Homoserinimonas aerilata]TQL47917.1 alanine racemase [Homoserinimonas aerilata]
MNSRPKQVSAEAVIDLAAYERNLALLTSRIAPARLMAVIKSDAYGHGLVPIARAAVAAGVTELGVLELGPALALRTAGIGEAVRLFVWLFSPDDDLRAALDGGVELGISTVAELDAIIAASGAKPARIHLKIDTGLHRNGADPEDWPTLVASAVAAEQAGSVVLAGVWTHISEASDEEDSASIARFTEAIAIAEGLGASFSVRHLAASAAGFGRDDARFDMVRFGAFCYGIAPGSGIGPGELGLTPVMTLRAPIVSVDDDPDAAGHSIATIPIGYGDGILSECAGRVEVTVGGRRWPVIEVGVDALRLRVDRSAVSLGDTARLFGPGDDGEATLQEWADALGTIGEEIVVRISAAIPRIHIG